MRKKKKKEIAPSVFVFGRHRQQKDLSIYGPIQPPNDSPNRPPAIEMAHQFNYFTTRARPMLSEAWQRKFPVTPVLVNMPEEKLFGSAVYSVASKSQTL